MYRSMYRIVFVSLMLLFSVFWIACGTDAPKTCTQHSDCGEQERCLRKQCRKKGEDNQKPVARIQAKRDVRVKDVVKLDGTPSTDPENTKLTFDWKLKSFPEGSKAELKDAKTDTASFTPDIVGQYVVALVVTDEGGLNSIAAHITIDAAGRDGNTKPTADAGIDSFAGVNKEFELDGSASSDADGDSLTYKWSIRSAPTDSAAKLDDATVVKPKITFDKTGKYIFELIVNDGTDDSATDSVSIEVIDDFDLVPAATKIDPAKGSIGTQPSVTITGTGFSKQAVVLFDGSAVSTNDVQVKSETEIVAKLDLAGRSAKDYPVVIRNPNGKKSQPLSFKVVELPTPTLTSMSPTSGITGAKHTITLKGTGFVTSSSVLFNLLPMPTTYKDETTLEAKVDLANVTPGEYKVKVQNPGGKASSELNFKVNKDDGFVPVLRVLNPSQATVGTTIPFSVHGSSFSPGAVIVFDGKEIPSIRQSRDTIEADPTLDLTKIPVGKYSVWVRNANGKISAKETFEVFEKDPAPKLDRILPPTFYINDKTKLDVYGNFFDPKVKLFIGTKEYSGAALTKVSKTYFSVSVDTTTGWSLGNVLAYVINPNGKKSGTFSLTVTNKPTVPPPVISRLSPKSSETGKVITSFYIYGREFCKTTAAKCTKLPKVIFSDSNGVDLQATKNIYTSISEKLTVSSPYIRGQLDLSTVPAGTYKIQLEHADTKAKSNTYTFTVRPPPTIRIDRLSPSSGDAGIDIPDFRIYASHFCSGSKKCSQLPTVYIKDANGVDLQLTKSVFVISTTVTSGKNPYIKGSLAVSKMPKGSYTFQIEHPTTKKKSTLRNFLVKTPRPLSLDYIYPYYAQSGGVVKCDINGGPFTAATYVLINGTDKVSLVASTSQKRRAFNFDAKTKYATDGYYSIQLCNSPTLCSNTFHYPVMSATGTKPFITAVKGPTYPLVTNSTVDLTIYGYRWVDATTAQLFLDGKEINTTNFNYGSRSCRKASSPKSSSNCRFTQFQLKGLAAGKHTMEVKWASTSSVKYEFYIQNP